MIGPASVLLTIFALVIKESPFYIDLSVTALVGVLLCWRLKSVGLYLASALLGTVLAYNFFLDGTPLTLWEAGLGASLQLTFVLTALASLELAEAFQQACKAVSVNALNEVEEWKVKISEALVGKDAAVSESESFKNKLLKLQDALKLKTEQSEMFERLLEMARTEMTETAKGKENSDRQYLEQKNLTLSVEATVADLNHFITLQTEEVTDTRRLISKLENELIEAQKEITAKNQLAQKQTLAVMDLEWKLEQFNNDGDVAERIEEIERYKSLASESKEKLEVLERKISESEASAIGHAEEIERYKSLASESKEKLEALERKISESEESASGHAEEIEALERKIADSVQEIEHYKSMAGDSAGKVEALGQQLEDLIDRLKNIQVENDSLQKELDAVLKPGNEPVSQGDTKELSRVMGLYTQLRSQFSEKSQNLDDTRKLLFHSQENLLSLQKEIEEKYVYDQEQSVASYEKHNLELMAQIKRLEAEVAELEELLKVKLPEKTQSAPPKVQVAVRVQPAAKAQAVKVQTPVKVQVLPKPKSVKKSNPPESKKK